MVWTLSYYPISLFLFVQTLLGVALCLFTFVEEWMGEGQFVKKEENCSVLAEPYDASGTKERWLFPEVVGG
jgi:hypothetical protein